MRRPALRMLALMVPLSLALPSTTWCGPAAGELSLDRAAVRELIALALPEPLELELPGLGPIQVLIEPPDEVRFHEGGVETVFTLRVSRFDHPLELHARYLPSIEPLLGTVQLEPESLVPATPLPFELDLAAWVGPVALPRRLDWDLELESGKSARVTCFIQGLTVEADRLRIELGLVGRPQNAGSTAKR